jgi:putative SOS response-associated peptidase YedK
MCGRFTSTSSIERLVETFAVDEVRVEALPLRYNVAPTQLIYAVAERHREGSEPLRLLGSYRWGLVPSWATDVSVGVKMINARAESLTSKPAFRAALGRRRCLIPADSWYEWAAGPAKQAYAISLSSGEPVAMAGLWELWKDRRHPEQDWLRSCTIVTTAASGSLAGIHPRMPAVLPERAWAAWLDTGAVDAEEARGLLVPASAELFRAWPVGAAVNRVANEGPELLDEVPLTPRMV